MMSKKTTNQQPVNQPKVTPEQLRSLSPEVKAGFEIMCRKMGAWVQWKQAGDDMDPMKRFMLAVWLTVEHEFTPEEKELTDAWGDAFRADYAAFGDQANRVYAGAALEHCLTAKPDAVHERMAKKILVMMRQHAEQEASQQPG